MVCVLHLPGQLSNLGSARRVPLAYFLKRENVSIKRFCEQFDRVYCISLPRSTGRRDYITGYFAELGIANYEFFDATDKDEAIVGRYFDDGLVQTYPPCFRCGKLTCGRDDCNNILIPSQVATFISYLRLWRKIRDANVGRALIVEDDVKFTDYAPEIAQAFVTHGGLDSISFVADKPVLLRLGWAVSDEHKGSEKPVVAKGLTRMSNPCHAITRALAVLLLERFVRVETTVDIYQHIVVGETVENYTLLPPLSYELSWSVGAMESLIHPKSVRVEYLKEHHADNMDAIESALHDVQMHFSHVTFRQLLVVGNPGGNTERMSRLLKAMGADVGHDEMGKTGICSWTFAVPDASPYAARKQIVSRSRAHFARVIHHVGNPRDAIPRIVEEFRRVPEVYEFCRRHILDRYRVDIAEGQSDVDKAVMIYVYWNKIIEDSSPDVVFKEDDDPELLRAFLVEHDVIPEAQCFDSPGLMNKSERRHIGWGQASKINIGLLNEQCRRYGYAEISGGTGEDMLDEMLLIGGCPRSGTTILQYVLNTDPHVFITNEMNLFKTVDGLGSLLGADASLATKRPHESPRALSVRESWTVSDFTKYKFDAGCTKAILRKIYEIHHERVRPGKALAVFGDKFPKYYQSIDHYNLAGSAFKYIHITRNPLDVINSMIMRVKNAQEGKDTWKAHPTLESQIAIWAEAFAFIRGRETDAQVLHVLYEDFVFNTAHVMEEIGSFLNMSLVWESCIENDEAKHFRRENIGAHELSVIDASGVYQEYVNYLQVHQANSRALEIAIDAQAVFDAVRKRAVKNKDKKDEVAMRNADRLTRRGEDFFSSGRLEEARHAFLEALRCVPGFVTAHNNLGVMAWHEGDVEDAVGHFLAALEARPDDEVALANLVEVLKSSGAFQGYLASLENCRTAGQKAFDVREVVSRIRGSISGSVGSPHVGDNRDMSQAAPVGSRAETTDQESMDSFLSVQGVEALKCAVPDFAARLASCRGFLQDRTRERIAKNHVFLKTFLGGDDPLDPFAPKGAHDADCFGILGVKPDAAKSHVISLARAKGKPVYVFENGFIRSIHTWVDGPHGPHLTSGISYIFDDAAAYYDSTRPSRLEWLLENSPLLDEGQIARARRNIEFIQENQLSKYNHQPLKAYKPKRPSNRNILVIDQSYNDYSVILGGADDGTFARMLDEVVNANPGGDIYVKVHPDSIAAKRDGRRGYYDDYTGHSRVTFIDEPINPICLIEPFDEIHVVTSQLGLEALLYGKRVVCHGMPFYAGWGLTTDKLQCARRTRTLTKEELFFIMRIRSTRCTRIQKRTGLRPLRRQWTGW